MEMAGSSNSLDVSAPTKDLKYMMASNVNVSCFVSVKLSGSSNYNIWKAQMICLLESQVLLHILGDNYEYDKGNNMIWDYDRLVKGWFFGSMDQKVLKNFVSLYFARDVWWELESTFNSPTSNGDTGTPYGKYLRTLKVKVSDYVSEKLSYNRNYNKWKNQMVGLLDSQELLHIIDASYPFPEEKLGVHMISEYDQLVKSWIFGSVTLDVLDELSSFESARGLWGKLDFYFSSLERNRVTEYDRYYEQANNVIVSDFVSVELSSHKNYMIWKTQMLCLIKSQVLLHIIDVEYPFPEDKGVHMILKYDMIVRDWFIASIEENLYKKVKDLDSARYVWMKLESIFDPTYLISHGDADLKYIEASNVNISSFVTVKLSGLRSYPMWKAQMLCLIESQDLLHIIKDGVGKDSERMTERYDKLIKGWLFASMDEELLARYVNFPSAKKIWWTLQILDSTPTTYTEDEAQIKLKFGVDLITDAPEIENIDIRKRLYDAAIEGCWRKAKSVLKVHERAATEAITEDGSTILHLAVKMGHNYFLEKLLEFLTDGKDIETKNYKGETALHIAAMVGNKYLAQLLVQKRPQLLEILDNGSYSPLDSADYYMKDQVYAYLFKFAVSSDSIYDPPVLDCLYKRQYDVALMLLKKDPDITQGYVNLLKYVARTFPTDLRFTGSFIYPSLKNDGPKRVMRGSLLFLCNIFDKYVEDILRVTTICNNTCCSWLGNISMILDVPITIPYTIYKLICLLIVVLRLTLSILYILMWKVLAATVPSIKNIENKKKQYQAAKEVLSFICDHIEQDLESYAKETAYEYSLLQAVSNDAYEVVDEILYRSPEAINYADEQGHNIIRRVIIYRSEKTYNLICHIIERKNSLIHNRDHFLNNIAHLAGRLAPSIVLDRTKGATQQLQRELQWREKIETLMSPEELNETNMDDETPAMVFTREHNDLLKAAEEWLKKTAESCSITAALIVTVVFAAAITVPGGSNQDTGIPVFHKEFAFSVFATMNALSLFTGTASLLLFLSILITRFSENDFIFTLPRRLIFGLSTLFISTVAMIIAFGAILFLVFCEQRPWMLAPILPILVIVTVKIPLIVDLVQSTYFPIFGKHSYLESCKINYKNTVFQ